MKQKITIEKIKTKQIILQQHHLALRKVLLSSSHWDKRQKRAFSFLKGGEEKKQMKRFFIIGTIIAVLIVATLFIVFSPLNHFNTQMAYAEQVAENSYNAVATLTPEQQAALKQKVKMDSTELLQEAKTAKDLKILTYDQFVSENPKIAQLPPPPDGKRRPDLHNAKFLQFTNKDGAKVTIGVDANNDLPVFVTAMRDGGNAAFQVRDEMPGLPDTKSGQVGFETTNGSDKGNITITVDTKGDGPVLTVDGKKYTVPTGVSIGPDNPPPTIKVEGNDVYVNDVKATPIN